MEDQPAVERMRQDKIAEVFQFAMLEAGVRSHFWTSRQQIECLEATLANRGGAG